MSDEETVSIIEEPITAKDPKKVEQGKRLAAISKEAKEKKMRERIRQEEFSYLPWIGYTISVFSTIGLVYMLISRPKEPDLEKTVIESPPPKKKKKMFETLD